MTTVGIIAAVVILVVGLFAVIVERTNERDHARDEVASLRVQLTEARLTDPTTATSQRVPWLRVVRETDDVPVADESWLDEITKPGGWSL